MNAKKQFIKELEPLLVASEQAIKRGDKIAAQSLALETLWLAREYADKLSPAEFRDALNNPTANAIAARLGVKPQ